MSPRMGELAPSEVWAAAARTLTALTGQPRTDLVGSDAALWSHATRTLTALDLQALARLPLMQSGYPAATAVTAAVVDTFGAWVQISANIGASKLLVAVVVLQQSGNNVSLEVEIGEGAGGAEAAVARVGAVAQNESAAGWHPSWVIPVWRALTSGARISARARDDSGIAHNIGVYLLVA